MQVVHDADEIQALKTWLVIAIIFAIMGMRFLCLISEYCITLLKALDHLLLHPVGAQGIDQTDQIPSLGDTIFATLQKLVFVRSSS